MLMFMQTKKILENKLSTSSNTSISASLANRNHNPDQKQSNSDNQSTTPQSTVSLLTVIIHCLAPHTMVLKHLNKNKEVIFWINRLAMRLIKAIISLGRSRRCYPSDSFKLKIITG